MISFPGNEGFHSDRGRRFCDAALSQEIGRRVEEYLLLFDPNSLPAITRAYNPEVEAALRGKAVVFRLATSKCAGDPVLAEEISLILRQYPFDVIHFNNGIHGPEYSDEAYGQGLRDLIAILRKYDPKAQLLWAATTPIRVKGQVDQLDPSNARAVRRNLLAAAIMKQSGIPTDDLYNLVLEHPEYYKPDGVHFNEKGVEVEAKEVAGRIAELLPEKPQPASSSR